MWTCKLFLALFHISLCGCLDKLVNLITLIIRWIRNSQWNVVARTFFSFTTTHISVQCRLFALHVQVLREHALREHERLTSSTTASGAACLCDKTGLNRPSSSNQPSWHGSGIWGWMTRSWLHILAWRWARRICWFNAPDVGGNLSTPWLLGRLLNRYYLRSQSVLAETFFVPRRKHKNSSHPVFALNDGSSLSPSLLKACATWGSDLKETLNAVFLPTSFIWPVMSQPVREWKPGYPAAFSGPRCSYIGKRATLLFDDVPVTIPGFLPSCISRFRIKTNKSVSCVKKSASLPGVATTSIPWSIINVSASFCELTGVAGTCSGVFVFTSNISLLLQ